MGLFWLALVLAAQNTLAQPRDGNDDYHQERDVESGGAALPLKINELLDERVQFTSSDLESDLREKLESRYIKLLLEFLLSPEIRDADEELLLRLKEDLLSVLPRDADASELESLGINYHDFAKIVGGIGIINHHTGEEGRFYRGELADSAQIRPNASHGSLLHSLQAQDFNYAGKGPDDWARVILAGFFKMRQHGAELEAQIYSRSIQQLRQINDRDKLGRTDEELREMALIMVDKEFERLIRAEGKRKENKDEKAAEAGRQNENEIQIKLGDWGKGEITQVDGYKVIKVIHEESGFAFIYLDEDKIRADGKHVRQILSRIQIEGGSTRTDGQTGRDVIATWFKNGNSIGMSEINRVETYIRPTKFSPGWWKMWKYATWHGYAFVRDGTFWSGQLCGAAQFGIICGLGAVSQQIDPDAAKSWHEILLGAGYTYFYGAWVVGPMIKSFIHWELRGKNRQMKKLRKFVKSFGYAYPFVVIITGDPVIGITTAGLQAAAQTHGRIIFNTMLTSQTKAYWQILPEIWEVIFRGHEQVRIPVIGSFFGEQAALFPRRILFYNTTEIGVNLPLKGADLMGISYHMDAIDYNFPISKVIYVSSYPLAMFIGKEMAVAYNHPRAEEVTAEWEKMKSNAGAVVNFSYGLAEDIALFPLDAVRRMRSPHTARLGRRAWLTQSAARTGATQLTHFVGNRMENISARWQRAYNERIQIQVQAAEQRAEYSRGLPPYNPSILDHIAEAYTKTKNDYLAWRYRTIGKIGDDFQEADLTSDIELFESTNIEPEFDAAKFLGYGIKYSAMTTWFGLKYSYMLARGIYSTAEDLAFMPVELVKNPDAPRWKRIIRRVLELEQGSRNLTNNGINNIGEAAGALAERIKAEDVTIEREGLFSRIGSAVRSARNTLAHNIDNMAVSFRDTNFRQERVSFEDIDTAPQHESLKLMANLLLAPFRFARSALPAAAGAAYAGFQFSRGAYATAEDLIIGTSELLAFRRQSQPSRWARIARRAFEADQALGEYGTLVSRGVANRVTDLAAFAYELREGFHPAGDALMDFSNGLASQDFTTSNPYLQDVDTAPTHQVIKAVRSGVHSGVNFHNELVSDFHTARKDLQFQIGENCRLALNMIPFVNIPESDLPEHQIRRMRRHIKP